MTKSPLLAQRSHLTRNKPAAARCLKRDTIGRASLASDDVD